MTSAEKKLWYNYLNKLFIPLNKGEDFLKENQGDSSLYKIKVLRQKIIDNHFDEICKKLDVVIYDLM